MAHPPNMNVSLIRWIASPLINIIKKMGKEMFWGGYCICKTDLVSFKSNVGFTF